MQTSFRLVACLAALFGALSLPASDFSDVKCPFAALSPGEIHASAPAPIVVVAHGQNPNTAMPGTWANFAESLRQGAQVLETDVQMTADGQFVLFHAPVLPPPGAPVLMPVERYDQRRIDGMGLHSVWRQFVMVDPLQRANVVPISLGELLGAVREPGRVTLPAYPRVSHVDEHVHMYDAQSWDRNALVYLDVKDLNAYPLRLYGHKMWDWVRDQEPTAELRERTGNVIRNLSKELTRTGTHQRVFVAARHPQVAAMLREIDPKIRYMISPETKPYATTREFLDLLAEFGPHDGGMVEVKYLTHILDPELWAAARVHHWTLFYNVLPNVDIACFQGKYQNDLPRLIADIEAARLPDVPLMIQANDVAGLSQAVSKP